MEVEIPKKAGFLFHPARYKVLYGGRGSAKSHSCAKALLLLGIQNKMRILCAREVQKSIKDSVKRLLDDQIGLMELQNFYTSYETEIRGRNGTEFLFTGLSSQTIDSVKSYEGISVCWIEEAQSVSDRSWQILTPTIRSKGSEIWITMNPGMDTDPTYVRFIENPPESAVVVEMNYTDNPYFPSELEQERLHCLATDPEGYKNIWEGKCRSAVDGAIYAEEMTLAATEGRVTLLPYDPKAKVHAIWDLGWNDSTSIVMVQKIGPSGLAVIDYIEDSHKTLDFYAKSLNDKAYDWGDWWLPHDATHGDLKTGTTVQKLLKTMRKGGKNPKITPKLSIEAGIRLGRMALKRAYFDKIKTARLLECLKRYRRSVSNTTGEPGAPVHDEFSHGADAWRYLGVVADQLGNDEQGQFQMPVVGFGVIDEVVGY